MRHPTPAGGATAAPAACRSTAAPHRPARRLAMWASERSAARRPAIILASQSASSDSPDTSAGAKSSMAGTHP